MARIGLLAVAATVASAAHLDLADMIRLYGRKVHTGGPVQLRTPKNVNETLRQAAAGKVYIGAEVCYQCLQNGTDTKYNDTAIAQFSLMTAENQCKWGGEYGVLMRPLAPPRDGSRGPARGR